MGDVGFGMELAFPIDLARDLAALQGLDDGRHARQKVVLILLAFQAEVQRAGDIVRHRLKRLPGA